MKAILKCVMCTLFFVALAIAALLFQGCRTGFQVRQTARSVSALIPAAPEGLSPDQYVAALKYLAAMNSINQTTIIYANDSQMGFDKTTPFDVARGAKTAVMPGASAAGDTSDTGNSLDGRNVEGSPTGVVNPVSGGE